MNYPSFPWHSNGFKADSPTFLIELVQYILSCHILRCWAFASLPFHSCHRVVGKLSYPIANLQTISLSNAFSSSLLEINFALLAKQTWIPLIGSLKNLSGQYPFISYNKHSWLSMCPLFLCFFSTHQCKEYKNKKILNSIVNWHLMVQFVEKIVHLNARYSDLQGLMG